MNKTLLLLFFISLSPKFYAQDNLEVFNNTLGTEQALAFDLAIESFVEFLEINYPDQKSLFDKNLSFLEDMQDIHNTPQLYWEVPEGAGEIVELWEKSGLRKEIVLWPNEKYIPRHYIEIEGDDTASVDSGEFIVIDEIIPIQQRKSVIEDEPMYHDSTLSANEVGKFLYAIQQCCSSDSAIYSYYDAKLAAGDISPVLMAGGLIFYLKDRINEPLTLRIIVAEFYYHIMRSEGE